MATSFEEFAELYKSTVSSVTDPQDYFSSDEYHELKRSAKLVFKKVKPKCDTFIGIVKGLKKGTEIGSPGIERALCFPKRFLNEPSTATLPHTLRETVNDIIEDTFFLGLMCHLFLNKFPTRDNVDRVDMQTLVNAWAPESLVADTMMKAYNKDLNMLPLRIFEFYHGTKIEPVLKKQLKMGFWSRAKCRSYFRNLLFSGARLGMLFDLATQNM